MTLLAHHKAPMRTGTAGSAALGLLATATAIAGAAAPAMAAGVGIGEDLITETLASRTSNRTEVEGIHAGNFFIRPSAAALVIFDDNIFARSTNQTADMRFELRPSIDVRSDLPRHILDFSLDGRIVNYAEHTDQNYENFQAKLRSALHFDHAHTLSFSALSALEHAEVSEITSLSSAAEPVPIFHNRVSAGLTRDAGRLYGTVSAAYENWNYSDVTSSDGTPVDEDVRDLSQYSAQFLAAYRFSPGYEVIGKIRTLRQTGDSNEALDATGYEALTGLAFETGRLLSWSLLVGYGYRDYDADSRDDTASSLLEAELKWRPTDRMTLTGTVRRNLVDTLDEEGESRVDSSIGARITYDILHNLTGHLEGAYSNADYIGDDRQDTSWIARAGLAYSITQDWSVTLNYEYQTRESTDDGFDMDRNRFIVGAKLKF